MIIIIMTLKTITITTICYTCECIINVNYTSCTHNVHILFMQMINFGYGAGVRLMKILNLMIKE